VLWKSTPTGRAPFYRLDGQMAHLRRRRDAALVSEEDLVRASGDRLAGRREHAFGTAPSNGQPKATEIVTRAR
jgi:hypothetical protein